MCAMNYSVSLEIFKSRLAFFPPESYTSVKLQLLDQNQEFIYSAKSTSTAPLALQTRQAPYWGGMWGSTVAQGQRCGEGVVFISPAFSCHAKGEAEGILSCSTDTPVCVSEWVSEWVEGKPHPCPSVKGWVLLARNSCSMTALYTERAKSLCAALFLALEKWRGRRQGTPSHLLVTSSWFTPSPHGSCSPLAGVSGQMNAEELWWHKTDGRPELWRS